MMPRAFGPLAMTLAALLLGAAPTIVSAETCALSTIDWVIACPAIVPVNTWAPRADVDTHDCGGTCADNDCCAEKQRCSSTVPATCSTLPYRDSTKNNAVCAALVCTETDCCTLHNTCSASRPPNCPTRWHRINAGVTCEGGGANCAGALGEAVCCAENQKCSAELEGVGQQFECGAQRTYIPAGQIDSRDGITCDAEFCTELDCCVDNERCTTGGFPVQGGVTPRCTTGLRFDPAKDNVLCAASTGCTPTDCCRPNLTCDGATYDCGANGSRVAAKNTVVCTEADNCSYGDCCLDHPYCTTSGTGYSCATDTDYAPRDNAASIQCGGAQCTRPECCRRHEQCSAAYPDNNSCDPVTGLKVLLLNPRQYCIAKDCQNADCCEDRQLCSAWSAAGNSCPSGTHTYRNDRCPTATCVQADCCTEHERCNSAFPNNNSCDRPSVTTYNMLLRPNGGGFSQANHCPTENCARTYCCQTKDACATAYVGDDSCRTTRGVFFSRNDVPPSSFCTGLSCNFDECCRAHGRCDNDGFGTDSDCGNNYSRTPGKYTADCPAYKCQNADCCSEHERCSVRYTSNANCRSGMGGATVTDFSSLRPDGPTHCRGLTCDQQDCCQAHQICSESTFTIAGGGCPANYIPDTSKASTDCPNLDCLPADCCIKRTQCFEPAQYPTNASCGPIHSVDSGKVDDYCTSTLANGLPTCQQSECCIINEVCGETMFDTCAQLTANGAGPATINGVAGIVMAGLDSARKEDYCIDEKCTVNECCGAREQCVVNFALDPTYCASNNLVRRVAAVSSFYCQETTCIKNECCATPTTCSEWFAPPSSMTCNGSRVPKPLFDEEGLPIVKKCEKDVCEENECCGDAGVCASQIVANKICEDGLARTDPPPLCLGTSCTFTECCEALGECALQPPNFCPSATHVDRIVPPNAEPLKCPDVACEDVKYCCQRKQQCIDAGNHSTTYTCKNVVLDNGIEYPYVLTEGVIGKICADALCTDTECCAVPGQCSDDGSECMPGESFMRTPLTGRPPGGFCKGITCAAEECCQPVPKCGDVTVDDAGVETPTFSCLSPSFAKKESALNTFCTAGMDQVPPVYECDDVQCCELMPASCDLWQCEGEWQPKQIAIEEMITCAMPPAPYDCTDMRCCDASTRSNIAGIVTIQFQLNSPVSFNAAFDMLDVIARTNLKDLPARIHRSRLILLSVSSPGQETQSLSSRSRVERMSVASQRRLLQEATGSEIEIGVFPKEAVDRPDPNEPTADEIATALKDALQDDTLDAPFAAKNPLFVINKSVPPTKLDPQSKELMVCQDSLLSVSCAIPARNIPPPEEDEAAEFPIMYVAAGGGAFLLLVLGVVWWKCIKSHNPNGGLLAGKNREVSSNRGAKQSSLAFSHRPQDTGGEYSSDSDDENGDTVNDNYGGPAHAQGPPAPANLNMSAIGVRINGGSVISSEDSETSSSDDD